MIILRPLNGMACASSQEAIEEAMGKRTRWCDDDDDDDEEEEEEEDEDDCLSLCVFGLPFVLLQRLALLLMMQSTKRFLIHSSNHHPHHHPLFSYHYPHPSFSPSLDSSLLLSFSLPVCVFRLPFIFQRPALRQTMQSKKRFLIHSFRPFHPSTSSSSSSSSSFFSSSSPSSSFFVSLSVCFFLSSFLTL